MKVIGAIGLMGGYFLFWQLLQRSKASYHIDDVSNPPRRDVDPHSLSIEFERSVGAPQRILNKNNFGFNELDVRTSAAFLCRLIKPC